MTTTVAMHNVQGIAARTNTHAACAEHPAFATLHIDAMGPADLKLEIVLSGESADAMRSMLRSALAVDYADKVSDAVIAAFKAYSSRLHGKTPEDEHPCEACLDALEQDVVNAVTEALR